MPLCMAHLHGHTQRYAKSWDPGCYAIPGLQVKKMLQIERALRDTVMGEVILIFILTI